MDGCCTNCGEYGNWCKCDEEASAKEVESVVIDHLEYLSGKRPPVLTKRDFVKRYAEGEFGNRSPTWNTLQEFLDSNYRGGLIHLRNRIVGGKTWYDVAPNDVDLYWQEALASGLSPKDLYISAMCPTEKTIIQGEVLITEEGVSLHYSTVKKPMRQALSEKSSNATGLTALILLETHLCSNSMEWMRTLWETYPHHVVEFTTLSVNWGTVPRHNTLFWEVRGGY